VPPSRTAATAAGLLCLSLLGLTACSSAASGASPDGGDTSTLVVYTNSGSDGRDTWWTEKAAGAGFDIQIVAAGGGDVVNRLEAEQNGPVADVVFGLNNMYFSQLDADELVIPYTPAWSSDVDPSLGDTTGDAAFWPLVQQATVLVYNPAAYTADDAPTSWTDLATTPRFAGTYEVVNQSGLGGATTQLIVAGIVSEYRDDNGDLGVSDDGWHVVRALFANGLPAEPDVPLFQRIADGTVNGGQIWTSGILGFEEQYGVQTTVAQPTEGVPFAIEQVALVAGSGHEEQAQEFIDWMGSGDVQGAFAQKFNAAPVNDRAAEQANPEAVELLDGVKHQDIDYAWASEHMGDWVEKITLQYLQ